MTGKWLDYPSPLLLLISPTRFVIDRLKRNDEDGGTRRIRNWTYGWLAFATIFIIIFTALSATGWVPHPKSPDHIYWVVAVLLWALPFSRTTELFIAFYRDAFQQLVGVTPSSQLQMTDRLRFLARSYLEVALDFGIVYFFLPSCVFEKQFKTLFQAIYFSATTITTVGYGDFHPTSFISQLLCIWELAVGFVLVVFTLGSYIASAGKPR
jgi:hypothetical protein